MKNMEKSTYIRLKHYCGEESKKDGKDQGKYNQVTHLTQDTIRESNKNTINKSHEVKKSTIFHVVYRNKTHVTTHLVNDAAVFCGFAIRKVDLES